MRFDALQDNVTSPRTRRAIELVCTRHPSLERAHVEAAATCDPSGDGTDLWWIIRQMLKGHVRMPADARVVRRRLLQLRSLVRGHLLKPRHAELSNYSTWRDLVRKLDSVDPPKSVRDKVESLGCQVLATHEQWEAIEIGSMTCARRLLEHSDWWHDDTRSFRRMFAVAPAVLLAYDGLPVVLVHEHTRLARQSGQIPVERGLVPWMLSCQFLKVFAGEIRGLLPSPGDVTQTEVLEIGDPMLAAEFATAKGERDEQLEEIAAADPVAAVHYAENLCIGPDGPIRVPVIERAVMKLPQTASRYARNVLRAPWPQAEAVIGQDACAALEYATRVVHGPFLVGEQAMATYPRAVFLYAANALAGRRFEAGEPTLVTEAGDNTLSYARHILQGRFPRVADHQRLLEHCPGYEAFVLSAESRKK